MAGEKFKMSDEKRREELKAKINAQLDNLSTEDLEKIAGGIFDFPGVSMPPYCRNCNAYFFGYSVGSKCPNCGERLVRD